MRGRPWRASHRKMTGHIIYQDRTFVQGQKSTGSVSGVLRLASLVDEHGRWYRSWRIRVIAQCRAGGAAVCGQERNFARTSMSRKMPFKGGRENTKEWPGVFGIGLHYVLPVDCIGTIERVAKTLRFPANPS